MSDFRNVEAARVARVALGILVDRMAVDLPVRAVIAEYMGELDSYVEAQGAPPWTPERPERPGTWSEVVPEDAVKAPDGQWYAVDAVARIGDVVRVQVIVGTDKHVTEQTVAGRVEIRRGPTGQAVDVFAAGGLTLEAIGR